MAKYPGNYDTTIPIAQDGITAVNSSTFNLLRDALLAVEIELGLNPKVTHGSVRNRLDYIESYIIAGGGVQLAQDLGGLATAPLVIGLYGNPILSTSPTLNYVLTWNGLAWEPKAPSIAGGDHNTLGTLQGGTTNQYYHLTSAQHVWLTAGVTTGYWDETKGGTGLTTYTAGDLLYADGTNSLGKLNIGSDGYVLTVSGGVPIWTMNSSSAIHNNLNGIQGGEANGYYHITPGEHQFVIDGYNNGNFNDGYQLSTDGSNILWEPAYYYAIYVGKIGTIPSNTDGYLTTNMSIVSNENFPAFVPSIQSKITKMKVVMSQAPGIGESITITLRKNEIDTEMSVTINNTSTEGENLTTLIDSVTPGSKITVRIETTLNAIVEDLTTTIMVYQSF